jgi:protein gp37
VADTKIEWATKAWNPVTGCTPVHAGCDNCYAKRIAGRHLPGHGFDDRDFSVVRCHPERLMEPLHWRKPERVFVGSMGDLFHKDVPFEFIDRVFAVMALCSQHTFIVLTKRPERMREYMDLRTTELEGNFFNAPMAKAVCRASHEAGHSLPGNASLELLNNDECWRSDPENIKRTPGWPLLNVILGVSVCDQDTADKFIPILLETPAARRAVSIEPMLGPVDLTYFLPLQYEAGIAGPEVCGRLPGLDWVIVGGETGPGARPMHPDWARSLRDQCEAAGVPFFFKQWGEWAVKPRRGDLPAKPTFVCAGDVLLTRDGKIESYESCDGVGDHAVMQRVGKKAAGCLIDGREWKQFPEAHQ